MSDAPVWCKLEVSAAAPVLEALASLLVDWGSGGVVEEAGGLAAYYAPDRREAVEADLARYAADLGTEGGPVLWTWADVPDENWWESWKVYFKPARVSPRLAVCPTWEAGGWSPGDPAVRTVLMDPGRAFGTGTHETTRLCLKILDEEMAAEPAASLLDVGCGSGILSIAARLLGVPRAVALDVDPIAAGAARENAVANGVAEGTLVTCADLRAVRARFPLAVANILYQVLLGLAPALADRVDGGGRLVLSGMLTAELPSAEAVYGRLGFAVERRETLGEWGALVLRKVG